MSCAVCREIWGEAGEPEGFEEYAARYPTLAHEAKRHLTRPRTAGLTVAEVAQQACRGDPHVRRAIANGVLAASTEHGGKLHVTRTDATRWIARGCPSGEGGKSWLSLASACSQYLFTLRELRRRIDAGELKTKRGTEGAMRGIDYVLRQQCAQLRERLGFTEAEAARRVGVTVERLRVLLEGLAWRQADGIPLATVQAAIKRRESQEGYTLDAAAAVLGMPLGLGEGAQARRHGARGPGSLGPAAAVPHGPMMQRLREALRNPTPQRQELPGSDWLALGQAAQEAGVSATTIQHWAAAGELSRRGASGHWRYHREAVRARARRYWQHVRLHRA